MPFTKKFWKENKARMTIALRNRKYIVNNGFKKGHTTNVGRRPSIESRQKMSNSRIGMVFSADHCKNLSLSHIGQSRPCTLSHRIKISEAHKNIPLSELHKIKLKESINLSFENGRVAWNKNIPQTEEAKQKYKAKRHMWISPLKDTSIEIKLQDYLRQLNITFYTHYYMNINHAYQCDIFIPEKNLVIEADGNYWHKYPAGNEIDHIRTKELLEKGYKVIRIWEHEIKEMKLEDFKDKINAKEVIK